jgi:hypothetical protein
VTWTFILFEVYIFGSDMRWHVRRGGLRRTSQRSLALWGS